MKKKNILILIITLFTLLSASIAGILYWIFIFPNINTSLDKKYHYLYIEEGETWNDVTNKLIDQDIVASYRSLEWAIYLQKRGKVPQCGKYDVAPNETNRELLNRISYGLSNKSNFRLAMTRYPDQVASKLARQLKLDSADLADLLIAPELLEKYGLTQTTRMALFHRFNGRVDWCSTPEEVVAFVEKQYADYWIPERREKLESTGLSIPEIHILASIVEEETKNYEDQRMVAGLYLNRLQKGMRLQADPTVRYGVGDFTINRVLRKHLKVDSPYNTYIYTGLPPSSIRIPTNKSIDAVLNFIDHKYIYMCANSDFSGTHQFSRTLSQHNKYARAYRRELNRRKIWK